MLHKRMRCSFAISACVAWLFVAAGCGGRDEGFDRYIAQSQAARAALDVVLAAWQSGQPPGQLTVGSSTVHAVDSQWRSGKKLRSYEILKQVSDEGSKRFAVKLNLRDASAPQVANYVIVGRDVMWVFRDTDYAHVSH